MITNEKQFRSTLSLIERLRVGLAALDTNSDIHPLLVEAQRSALTNQIKELEEDASVYEALRTGQVRTFNAPGLHDLPDILIKARIARGMSQKELADFLGLKEQQIQRYEAERYRSASLDRLMEVAGALNVQISESAELLGDGQLGEVDPSASTTFPIAEMFKRGWFEDFSGSLAEARKSADMLIPQFFRNANAAWMSVALHRKSVRTGSRVHEPAMAVWEARVLTIADRNPPACEFVPARATSEWINALVHLSAEPDGPKRVEDHLRIAGIVLVIEPHLPGTHLDGAAMRSANKTAIVGMTLRHDRLDNFWFTLLHEVAHLVLHINNEFTTIFDDTESLDSSNIEVEADQFAQEALLSSDMWHTCLSRFTRTEKAVLADAKRLNISPAIIAGRIRRDAKDFTLLRSLVGAGEPRRQLIK